MSSELQRRWEHAGGSLPDGWSVVPFESLLRDNKSIAVGVMYPGADTLEGIPLVRVGDINEGILSDKPSYCISNETNAEYKRTQLQGDEILITLVGNPGECVIVKPHMAGWNAARAIAVVRLGDTTMRLYLKAILESSAGKHLIDGVLNTTVQRTLNLKDLKQLPIPIPPRRTIQEISSFFEAITDRIALLRETNATLEAIAQALFKSWFVDFDPVRAKQEGRTPEGMSDATAALFPDSFEESAVGLVPRGWTEQSIGDISKILNGFAFKSEDYVSQETGIFVLRTTNFSDDGYAKRLPKDVFLPTSFLTSHAKFLCESFDFHLVMVGASVGTTSTLLPHMLPALRNQNMWCFRPANGFPSKFFIHEMVKLKVVEALRSTSGSAREFLRKGDFEKNRLTLPTTEVLLDFENRISALKNKIATNENQADLLMEIRDTLLPRLISGKLLLPEAEALLTA